MKKMHLPYIYIIIAGILWGTIVLPVRLLASMGLSSTQIVVSRFVTVSIVFAAYIYFTDKSKFKIAVRDIPLFFAFGFLCILIYNICFTITIQLTSVSIAVGLLYTSPIWAMLMSIPVFNEKLTKTKAAAAGLSFLGCALMSGLLLGEGVSLSPLSLLTGVSAGIGYGSYGIFAKTLLKKYDSLTTMFYPFLFLCMGGIFFCRPVEMAALIAETPLLLLYIFLGAFFCYVIPYGLYTYSLNFVEASKAAVIVSIEPVSASLFGFLFFSERLTPQIAGGMLLILAAIYILNRNTAPIADSNNEPE